MQAFALRTLTGALVVGAIIAALLVHPAIYFSVFLAITIAALLEWYQLRPVKKLQPQVYLGLFYALTAYALSFAVARQWLTAAWLSLLVVPLVVSQIAGLYSKQAQPLLNTAFTLLGATIVTLPFILFHFVAFAQPQVFDARFLLAFFILIWSQDTFAYLTGMLLGSRPLFPKLSPKKSWEGFIGGTLAVFAISLGLQHLQLYPAVGHWALWAALVAVFSTWGDLVESQWKRQAETKDSGSLLPGHGGVLDRFDSVLLAFPPVWLCWYLLIQTS